MIMLKKNIACESNFKSTFLNINPGYIEILNKNLMGTFDGFQTHSLATCVGVLMVSSRHIGLAHSDTFKVMRDIKDNLGNFEFKKGDRLTVVFAYNPWFKQISNPKDWAQELKNEANRLEIKLNVQFYAVSGVNEVVGIDYCGNFCVSKNRINRVVVPQISVMARYGDYFYNSQLRHYDDQSYMGVYQFSEGKWQQMPFSKTPEEAEARLEYKEMIDVFRHVCPTNAEWVLKNTDIRPLLIAGTILMIIEKGQYIVPIIAGIINFLNQFTRA